jgi:hypothetical protein
VTAGNDTVARLAAQQRDVGSAARPTADIKAARKDDWIIATGNAGIGDVVPRPA